jgi:hypothetical protein
MFLNNLVKCYYTIALLNVILIIVLLYGTFVVKLITYKIEKIQEKALRFITTDFTSSYNNVLVKCNKTPLYVTRIRK